MSELPKPDTQLDTKSKLLARYVQDKKKSCLFSDVYLDLYSKPRNVYESCDIPKSEQKPKKMNVLVIKIDSVSYNQFRRMFPDTFEFLSKSLKHNNIFENFMIVGQNTRPNTFPWLGGVSDKGIEELGIESEGSKYSGQYSELFPFIWKDFQKLGHVTAYNEDFLINGDFKINKEKIKLSKYFIIIIIFFYRFVSDGPCRFKTKAN